MAFALSFSQLFSDSVGESHFASVNIELVTRNFAPPLNPLTCRISRQRPATVLCTCPADGSETFILRPRACGYFFSAGRLSSRPVTVSDVASRQEARYCLGIPRARDIRVVSSATCRRFSPWFKFDVVVSLAGAQAYAVEVKSCSRRCQSELRIRPVSHGRVELS